MSANFKTTPDGWPVSQPVSFPDDGCHNSPFPEDITEWLDDFIMKLWLIEPIDGSDFPAYDAAWKFLVRAKSEFEARLYAMAKCGDEGPVVWMDPRLSTCVQVTDDGEPGVVIRDFHEG